MSEPRLPALISRYRLFYGFTDGFIANIVEPDFRPDSLPALFGHFSFYSIVGSRHAEDGAELSTILSSYFRTPFPEVSFQRHYFVRRFASVPFAMALMIEPLLRRRASLAHATAYARMYATTSAFRLSGRAPPLLFHSPHRHTQRRHYRSRQQPVPLSKGRRPRAIPSGMVSGACDAHVISHYFDAIIYR